MIKIKSKLYSFIRIQDSEAKSKLMALVIPIFIETLLIMMLGAVDTIMLSRFSDDSVAAVGVVNQLIMFTFLIFEVINIGTSVLCSQYIGAGQRDKVVQVVGVSLIVNIIFGISISALLYFGSSPILQIMGLKDNLLTLGVGYMKIVGAFAFFQAVSLTISASLKSANKAIYPMIVTVIVNILNIIGNYTLIFGKFGVPAMGVEGAAISTAFARGVAMVILFIILLKKYIPSFPKEYFTPFPFSQLKNLLKVGIPSAGENMSYSLSQVVLTFFIAIIGTHALATRTYVVNIVMFVYLFAVAMAQGGAICIGHFVGMKKNKAAFVLGKYVMRVSIIVSLVLSMIWAIAGNTIFSWLTDNRDVIVMGTYILFIEVFLEIGRAINIYATNALRAAGDVFYPFYVGLVVQWSVAVGIGYLLGIYFGLGLIGMWCAFAIDENIRGVIFVKRWNSFKWAKKSLVR